MKLSVKWNTVETLFNIDNISDYIKEHIKNPHQDNVGIKRSLSQHASKQISKFFEIPDKIKQIREQLEENKDFIQEIIGTMSDMNNEGEESEENLSNNEHQEELSFQNNENLESSQQEGELPDEFDSKHDQNSHLILETVEEEDNGFSPNLSQKNNSLSEGQVRFVDQNPKNAKSVNHRAQNPFLEKFRKDKFSSSVKKL